MADTSFIDWPFFADGHRAHFAALADWCAANDGTLHAESGDVDADCRRLVRLLGEGGWLRHAVPAAYGGASAALGVRTLCLTRMVLGYHAGLADFAFAMQGLGTGAISLFGSEAVRQAYLPKVATGEMISGFALSEQEAGSDVAAMATTAERVPGGWRINGEKTWISNGTIADLLTVFARSGEAPGARGLSAFVLPTATKGFSVVEKIDVIAPHPLATIRFDDCFVPDDHLIGKAGDGFKIAMATLDVFRSTVGAAALGFARRATDEALGRATSRTLFGAPLSDLQLSQAALADMALGNDASALLIFRAAWAKDRGQPRVTREAAMAKLYATDTAQQTIDKAVQLFGGAGVVSGNMVERLYREIRALRIYEGASEVQKVVIARAAIAEAQGAKA
ncbi:MULTISPECIES: acyl-CoA dehydrogenase family protein [unclassified Sphingomonas]|uniref:acyl-CoA dehydrogenase family protein n=1 Tax=unclassified Sphingomonas TaxID=196159 RepID=UPI0006FE8771|nr:MULTISPECIES: acyl-CoA dehydrogenase family protein [unclassified Sphingomonas]KQX22797.1 acyl-CoA dehydrogenase [Sphingomonas sp. Root1294]KQY67723.1 acyl-CoA dehydrogenase [Sphingomonas sp. Root50]KRB88666.1 acyl-CoA dehydrogenase [Sphingomonas sp. Root720]